MFSKFAQMKEERTTKAHAESTSSLGELVKSSSKLSATLAVKRRIKGGTIVGSPATTRKTDRPQTIEKSLSSDADFTSSSLPSGIAVHNMSQGLRYPTCASNVPSSNQSTPITQRQHSVPSSPSCPNPPTSLRYTTGSRNSPGVQSTRSYDQRYQIYQQHQQSEPRKIGYLPPGYTLPYFPPDSCIGTPQIQRQSRYGSKKEMVGGIQGSQTPQLNSRHSQNGYAGQKAWTATCKPTKILLNASSEAKNSVHSSSSNSETSRDSGVNSQDGLTPTNEYCSRGASYCTEDMPINKSCEIKGFSTPQCVSRSGRIRGQKNMSAQASVATPMTSRLRSDTSKQQKSSETTKKTEQPAKYGDTLNRSKSKTATIRQTSRLPVCTNSHRNSIESQFSASTSCTSSPPTPRASWSAADSSTGSRSPRAGSLSKIAIINRSSNLCSTPATEMTRSQKSVGKKIPRPTRLVVDGEEQNHVMQTSIKQGTEPKLEDIEKLTKKIQEHFQMDSLNSERSIRQSSLPTNDKKEPPDPLLELVIRAKTHSPPPASTTKQDRPALPSRSTGTSVSGSITSSSTPAQNSTLSSLITLASSSRGGETSMVGSEFNRALKTPPVLSVAPIPTSANSSAVPQLTVECTLEDLLKQEPPLEPLPHQHYRHLHVPGFDGPGKSPTTPQRIMSRPVSGNQPRSGGGEDQLYGVLGYIQPPSSPLSHIKLPYATTVPMMQRMQVPAVSTNGVPPAVCHSQSNTSICRRSSNSEAQAGMVKSSIYATSNLTPSISDTYGSHISLSSTSSAFSPQGSDICSNDVVKLKRELEHANHKVATLTCQLSANASVVQAFEQSLASMNNRLQQLTATSVIKDKELHEMRRVIERFRCQASLDVWLMETGQAKRGKELSQSQEFTKGHLMDVLNSGDLQQAESLSSLLQSPSHGNSYQDIKKYLNDVGHRAGYLPLQLHQQHSLNAGQHNPKKAGWLRSSISRAFRRSKSRELVDQQKVSSTQDVSAPSQSSGSGGTSYRQSPSSSTNDDSPVNPTSSIGFPLHTASSQTSVATADLIKLQHQLADKDLRLTDAQLESLSRFHQLETMQEMLSSLQKEVASLKAENEMLHRTVDRSSVSSTLEISSGLSNTISNRGKVLSMLRDLFNHETPNRKLIPVFLELGHRTHGGFDATPSNHRRYLTLPQHPHLSPGSGSSSPNPSTRMMQHPGGDHNESREHQMSGDSMHLHLLGRIPIEHKGAPPSLQIVREKVKDLFKNYLVFLDIDDQMGMSCSSLSSMLIKCIPAWTPEGVKGNQPSEYLLRTNSPDNCSVTIDEGNEISRIILRLHDNAYAERTANCMGQDRDLLNPVATSSIAWISLLPCELLRKMIESLLAKKCVIIYGPKGAGKLEFGRILIESMAKMFPGFWTNQPTVLQYHIRATPNACNELRQVLLNGLAFEGLIILRLPPALLSDLVRTMAEVNFHTHPKKILLLAITDTLHFPEAPTKLQSCPGVFPFFVDLQSTASYMRRCLKQRFSQYAFQCLESDPQQQQRQTSMKTQNCSPVTQELEYLGDVLDWLPDFWLRIVSLRKALNINHDLYPLSPFRLLICPLTLQSSWMWFKELWEAEVQSFLHMHASSVPAANTPMTLQQRLVDVTRWMFATWPWPELPSCVNGMPQLQRKEGAGYLLNMGLPTQSLSLFSISGPKEHPMCSSDLVGTPSSVRENTRPESNATLCDSSSSLPALFQRQTVS